MISAELGDTLESFVTQLVAAGRFNSKSEVLREGVRMVQEREARMAALNAAVTRGHAEADAGLGRPAVEVMERLQDKYRAMIDTAA